MVSRRTWTLVAVVLGSGIVFLDSTIVNVALRAIGDTLPTSMVGVLEGSRTSLTATCSRCRRSSSWPARWRIGTAAGGSSSSACRLRRCLAGLRAGADHGVLIACPPGAGRLRRLPGAHLAGADQCHLRGRGTWSGLRHLGGGHQRAYRWRARGWRHPDRHVRLAVGLPGERAAGHRRRRDRPDPARRKPQPRRARSTSTGWVPRPLPWRSAAWPTARRAARSSSGPTRWRGRRWRSASSPRSAWCR